jgi:pectate lyase
MRSSLSFICRPSRPAQRLAAGACILLMPLLGSASAQSQSSGSLDSKPYLQSVQTFADTVLKHGRDTYGDEKTPLFVDGLHVETFEPVRWKFKGQEWVLSNFANQQQLFRVFDGLTTLTGDTKYREAAEAATKYALENLVSEGGLMYWGGHTAWDLIENKPVGTLTGKPQKKNGRLMMMHELKVSQPYFEMMHRVNPEAAKTVMSSIWGGHVVKWETLDFNRHARTHQPAKPKWDSEFDETGPVPFETPGGHLSFAGVAPPFIRSATILGILADDAEALKWNRRMVNQWQRAKHPETGLSGGQLSWRVGHDRSQEALQHVHPGINEASIMASYHVSGRYKQLPVAQLQAAEMLIKAGGEKAKLGEEFKQWAVDDLKIFGEKAWDPKTGTIPAMLTDGTRINPSDVKEGYYTAGNFKPQKPEGQMLWAYAMAYRMSGDKGLWPTMRSMALTLGVGDIGTADGQERKPAETASSSDFNLIYALIDLSRATEDKSFLRTASRIGDNLLKIQSKSGLYPRPAFTVDTSGSEDHAFSADHNQMPAREYARTGDVIPLALISLAAAIDGRFDELPQPASDAQFFHCPYHGELKPYQKKRNDPRTYDWLVFFGPTAIGAPEDDDE